MQVRESRDLVEVPKIGTPFPVGEGPYAKEAQRRHMQWANEYGVFRSEGEQRRFAAMDIGALGNLLYPKSSSPEDAQLVELPRGKAGEVVEVLRLAA